mmetsp:Transcript_17843/g.43669  ORF Transcript_17843/g.43669 Transcript_17843/m.43669 type:complete len:310 (-) Transcript_17843:2196-3125(-)
MPPGHPYASLRIDLLHTVHARVLCPRVWFASVPALQARLLQRSLRGDVHALQARDVPLRERRGRPLPRVSDGAILGRQRHPLLQLHRAPRQGAVGRGGRVRVHLRLGLREAGLRPPHHRLRAGLRGHRRVRDRHRHRLRFRSLPVHLLLRQAQVRAGQKGLHRQWRPCTRGRPLVRREGPQQRRVRAPREPRPPQEGRAPQRRGGAAETGGAPRRCQPPPPHASDLPAREEHTVQPPHPVPRGRAAKHRGPHEALGEVQEGSELLPGVVRMGVPALLAPLRPLATPGNLVPPAPAGPENREGDGVCRRV